MNIDPEALAQWHEDALAGSDPRLSERRADCRHSPSCQTRAGGTQSDLAAEALKVNEDYLADNAAREGVTQQRLPASNEVITEGEGSEHPPKMMLVLVQLRGQICSDGTCV